MFFLDAQTTCASNDLSNSTLVIHILCRGGDWKTGGNCHLETHPDVTPVKSLEQWADFLNPVNDVLGNSFRPKLLGLDILNVTQMTAQRKDGHVSVHLSPSGPVPLYRQDCSHWCLPGVPDTWNELVYNLLLKRQSMIGQNVPLVGTKTLKAGWRKLNKYNLTIWRGK